MADIASSKNEGLLCPTCRIDLVMSERQGIEIDYCPKCRGVWLDRGKLDKIIERSVNEQDAPFGVDRAASGQGAGSARPPGASSPCGRSPPQPYPTPNVPQSWDSRGGHGDNGHGGGGHGGGGHGGRRGFLGRIFD